MHVLTLLSKIVDDASVALSNFESWEDEGSVCYTSKIISAEVMDILDVDNVCGDCTVAFKTDDNNYFAIDSISYADEYGNEITCNVSKTINDYMESQGLNDIYHRLCEEAVNLAVL